MFGFGKRKTSATTVVLTICGMHCTNCALTIDDELEQLVGVIAARTSYAHQTTTVEYDAAKVQTQTLVTTLAELGYEAVVRA